MIDKDKLEKFKNLSEEEAEEKLKEFGKGSGLMKYVPKKLIAKVYAEQLDDDMIEELFACYHGQKKEKQIKLLIKALKKRNRPIPDFIKENYKYLL